MYHTGYCKDLCNTPGTVPAFWIGLGELESSTSIRALPLLHQPHPCFISLTSTSVLPPQNKNTELDPQLPSDFCSMYLCHLSLWHKTGMLLGSSRFRQMVYFLISKGKALTKLLAECLITFYSLLASNYSKLFLN